MALDLALQCAPDHPWAKDHREWFTELPDGTIAYAENPPKKYQDIYPLNFDNDPGGGLYDEVLRVVRHWMDHGIKIFRVDNPHTKPPNFWAWLISQVKAIDPPDVLFLAEAFTRPARLNGLAKLGFTQSYSYFTWRTAKWEIEEFGRQIAEHADYTRPNLFVNTPPDILHESLQHGGPRHVRDPGGAGLDDGQLVGGRVLRLRTVRAPARAERQRGVPGLREVRVAAARLRGSARPRAVAGAIPAAAQRNPSSSPALCQMRTITFHHIDNDALLAYSKFDPVSGDTVLVVVTLNAFGPEEGTLWLDMAALGMQPYDRFWVRDEITGGEEYQWGGQSNYVRLEPARAVAHILNMPLIPQEQRAILLRRE